MIKSLLLQIWPLRVKIILAIVVAGITSVILFVGMREPRNDRVWAEELAYTTTGSFNADGTASIENIRDFAYGDGTVLATSWIPQLTLNPREIVKVWFVLEPFATWKAVGHTFLTFEFADGSAYSFSVEARREKSETYSVFKGLFRDYELAYTWGSERDFITRRLLYLKHPVRMYPLTVGREGAQALFRNLLEKTNEIAEHPRFYNTFTANCTNVLADIVNQMHPGTIPLDISWYLPGFSDRFLMRIGLIATDRSVENTQQDYDLTPKRDRVLDIASRPDAPFGRAIRSLFP